jgi:hypothetical protein
VATAERATLPTCQNPFCIACILLNPSLRQLEHSNLRVVAGDEDLTLLEGRYLKVDDGGSTYDRRDVCRETTGGGDGMNRESSSRTAEREEEEGPVRLRKDQVSGRSAGAFQ